MPIEEINRLKDVCKNLVRVNYSGIKGMHAKSFVFAFWKGVMAVSGPIPYVEVCLMAGRYEELCNLT